MAFPVVFLPTAREGNVFTGRNEVLAKVIFSEACVILSSRGGGGGLVPGGPPNFRGVLQIFLGGPPIFRGGFLQFFGGEGGSSNFSGGFLQIFGGVSNFSGGGVSTGIQSPFGWYASYWNACVLFTIGLMATRWLLILVMARLVHILLKYFLVFTCFKW